MTINRTLFLFFTVCLLAGGGISSAAKLDLGRCRSLLESAPEPNHIPGFKTLFVKGYKLTDFQEITFVGNAKNVKFDGDPVPINGRKATILIWTKSMGKPRTIGLEFKAADGTNDRVFAPVVEVLKSPEIKKTYSKERASINDRQYETNYEIKIDRFKDPETKGFINRALLRKRDPNDPDFPQGLRKFARNFKLAKKLGFDIDEERDILYYPDTASFNERLQTVYLEWGVNNGILAKEVAGEIPGPQWIRILVQENRIGVSGTKDYLTHWHDWDEHTLTWIAGVDAIKVLRERLIFLNEASHIIKRNPKGARKLLKIIEDGLLPTEGDKFENRLPNATYLIGLLDQDPSKRSVFLTEIRGALLLVGGQSADELKEDLLKNDMPAALRTRLSKIPVSNLKIDSGNIDEIMRNLVERFQ